MKKFFTFVLIIALGIFCYYKFFYAKEGINKILKNTEEEVFNINKYTIFETHLNIGGCINKVLTGDLKLIIKNNKEEIELNSIFTNNNNTCFNTSNKNNDGIYLDNLKNGEYIFLVKEINDEEVKYYSLGNDNDYNDLTYYTITRNNKNNKIYINFDMYNNKQYLNISIKESALPSEVYDITIDPGHGGRDIGASYKLDNKVYTESELTLKISLLLKQELEDLGLKVKLTRDSDVMLDNYGASGRAVIPNKSNSKYSLSIHINSSNGNMNYGGVEIYVPNDVNYNLSELFAKNISEIVGYSKKPTDKVSNGVYYTYFTKKDVEESTKESVEKNLKPYDIVVGAPYMFMIREVGGSSTHAYVDGRNKEHGINEFSNSNQTAEPYLLELGYINYKKDLENLVNKSNLFSKAISDAIEEYLNIS